jgi:hypothetical protein
LALACSFDALRRCFYKLLLLLHQVSCCLAAHALSTRHAGASSLN